MDNLELGLQYQRVALIVDENRRTYKPPEKAKTRANWFELQE
jgi:hypothetical protein